MRAVFYAVIAIAVSIVIYSFVIVPIEAAYPFHFPFGAVYISIELPVILRMAAILLIVSLIASFLPARRVMKMKIMDAIWG
jgi:ABC-type antimicrobial peptide transport system permease subunit